MRIIEATVDFRVMLDMKRIIKKLFNKAPFIEGIAKKLYQNIVVPNKETQVFPGSERYWERRYSDGANSGAGSYGRLAEFKADVLNSFVATHDVQTVIEFGCGDGNQLKLAHYNAYRGFDVSQTAIRKCRDLFNSDERKSFDLISAYDGEKADLSISLDVIYHLIEDSVSDKYMRTLFNASNTYVIIYSSNYEQVGGGTSAHVRHRNFTSWVENHLSDWELADHLPNRYPYDPRSLDGSFAEFYFYKHHPRLDETNS